MTHLTGKQRLDIVEQHLLRIEAIVDLAAAFGSDQAERPDGALEEVLDDLFCGERRSCDPSMHPLFDIADRIHGDDKDYEELAYQLARANKLGYVVQFATPVRENADENGCSFSWGHCYLKWFYGENLDHVWQLAKAWSEHEEQRAIAANKK